MTYGIRTHRDGSVTIWDVYAQQWVRTFSPGDAQLASLDPAARARVMRHLERVQRSNP